MTCWVLIPIKAPEACKTRLSPVLDEAARRALAAGMLHHVAETASAARGVDEAVLLGPSHHGLSAQIRRLADPGGGLNAALASALPAAVAAGLARVVVASADLPQLRRADVESLAALPAGAGGQETHPKGTRTTPKYMNMTKGGTWRVS